MTAEKIPVIEIFGPVIQGEGAVIGQQTMFIRFGGCDFRCTMCDSMHAVDQEEIRKRASHLTQEQILKTVLEQAKHTVWITLSGGNPCLWELYALVNELRLAGKKVALETQGTYWKPWVSLCDVVTISPKGPGMGEKCDLQQLEDFIDSTACAVTLQSRWINLKIVCFGTDDIEFAKMIHKRFPDFDLYLSVGNPYPPGYEDEIGGSNALNTQALHTADLLECFVHLSNAVMKEPELNSAIVLPQLHVLAYGNEERR